MKKGIFYAVFLIVLSSVATQAQTDSTGRKKSDSNGKKKIIAGMAVYGEFGVISNSTMNDMRKELKVQNVDPFNSYTSSLVLAHRVESAKWMMEHRILVTGSGKFDETTLDQKRANLWGFGIGLTGGPKLVSTSRINVYVPIGVDLMYYQMVIKSNPSASLNKLINNPGTYQPIKMATKTVNVSAGLGFDYKTGWFSKIYDNFAIATRAAYHLPVYTSGQWRGENVQVNDLTSFKPSQLYLSIGIVASIKHMEGKWRRGH
jgi:hypothetical protein